MSKIINKDKFLSPSFLSPPIIISNSVNNILSINKKENKREEPGDIKLINFPTDPKKFGPGVWFSLHLSAINAIEDEYIKFFINQTKTLISKLPCKDCSDHAINYMQNNPIEQFIELKDSEGNKIGMFKWTWMFHNDVNSRLGKSIIDWLTAYYMYKNEEMVICPLDCANH